MLWNFNTHCIVKARKSHLGYKDETSSNDVRPCCVTQCNAAVAVDVDVVAETGEVENRIADGIVVDFQQAFCVESEHQQRAKENYKSRITTPS